MKLASKNSLFSKFLTVCLGFGMFLYCACLRAQYNLVQNPSFEYITACPFSGGEITYAFPWDKLLTGGGLTPDLCNACANQNAPWVGVPSNGINVTTNLTESYQMAKTGVGYAGIITYLRQTSAPQTSYREYVQSKLKYKLTQGKSYCVKAYISMYDSSCCGIDEFGILLDNGIAQASEGGTGPILTPPTIKSPTNAYMMDTMNWMEVSGSFVAAGDEEYITLGTFKNNINTNDTLLLNVTNGWFQTFHYIDDVSVIESDLPAHAGRDTALASASDSVFLGREPEIGLECVWYDMQGNIIGTGAGFWAHPTHTTSYIVEQNLCGNIKRDTVTVSLGVDIAESAALQGLSISPNPTQGTFRVSAPFSEAVQVQLLEISGKRVYEGKHTVIDGGFSVDVSGLAQGVYVLQVQDMRTGQQAVRKVLVE